MGDLNSRKKPVILIVDDAPDNIILLSSFLRDNYQVKAAISGEKALEITDSGDIPDIILLDIIMSGMDGYQVCKRLKENPKTAEIPVIFLTAKSDVEDERKGFELGAVDFIIRPISPHIVKARVMTHLQLKSARDFLRDKSVYLEKEVARRVRENMTLQDVAMIALGSLAETRDNETGEHIQRTQRYMELLANVLKNHPRFADGLAEGTLDLIIKSAPLHDIGKVGIPDSILLKPGQLTTEEFEIMKSHTTLGHDAIERAEKLINIDRSFLRFARDIAYTHHEKWDGSGYPRGLAGDMIPIAGRLMAVADVYDALVSKRVYKDTMTHEEAIEIIKASSGTHFDPDIVTAFVAINEVFKEIIQTSSDLK